MLTIAAVWSAAIYYYYYVGTYFDGGVEEKGKPSSIASIVVAPTIQWLRMCYLLLDCHTHWSSESNFANGVCGVIQTQLNSPS